MLLLVAGLGACVQYRLYWGDVHGHTANSDGKGSVADYFAHAREVAALDFAIVTDHDFGNAPPWQMPVATWMQTQQAADACTHAGRFVAIAGYEWTSQPKYWSGFEPVTGSERLFEGPPRFYNHKNAYFPAAVPYLFPARDPAYATPDLLAAALRQTGGLAHHNHPDAGPGGRDQWSCSVASREVIANTEIGPDRVHYAGRSYAPGTESVVRAYLDRGGRTGFVAGTDTHEGRPAARTAVFARELTRAGIFEALRSRRCYAITHARIRLEFTIDGHWMGEEIEVEGQPELRVDVRGTHRIEEIVVVRDGSIVHTVHPGGRDAQLRYVDPTFAGESYYYVRVTQVDADEHGNPSRAWASPIWVRRSSR